MKTLTAGWWGTAVNAAVLAACLAGGLVSWLLRRCPCCGQGA